MKKKSLLLSLVTLGPVGYIRGGGTLATLVTLPCVYGMHKYIESNVIQALIIIALCVVSFFIVKKVMPLFNSHDPSEIVLDEVIGTFVTFLCIDINWYVLGAGFLLFRFFDIFKPFGIKKVEQLPGAWGIIADDVLAAIYAAVIMRCIVWSF